MRKCAKPRCNARISSPYLACRDHWMKLSPDVREQVYARYRAGDPMGATALMFEGWKGAMSKQT